MPADSTRFLVQNIMNILICNYASKKIYKEAISRSGKKTLNYYLIFILFAIAMIILNQLVFFYFKPRNLYEELQLKRSMSLSQIQQAGKDIKVKIMQIENMPMNHKMQQIKKLQSMIMVLSHPARRLTYDSFGQTQTQYAWAFKSQHFLLSTIMGSGIFYIICTVINMISRKRSQLKQAFKMQIMVMILLFLWEIQLIMKTQNRIHDHTDFLDSIYTAFPIFQRREMIKIILIPSMNIIQQFFKFYVESDTQRKFIRIAKNQVLREKTLKVREVASKVQIDEHIEDRLMAVLSQEKKKNAVNTDIYLYQRRILQCILYLEGENILVDNEITFLLRYFMIK